MEVTKSAQSVVSRNGALVFVRINSGERRHADAKAATKAGATGLVLAKAETAELGAFDLPLIAMLESPGAVLDARTWSASKRAFKLAGINNNAVADCVTVEGIF